MTCRCFLISKLGRYLGVLKRQGFKDLIKTLKFTILVELVTVFMCFRLGVTNVKILNILSLDHYFSFSLVFETCLSCTRNLLQPPGDKHAVFKE